ncbi:MAG: nucleotidyltransferase domain-containing protein [Prevotella sp.]|nr:nucleotidyltransferase domain-containing protein [Prevotella sp.]
MTQLIADYFKTQPVLKAWLFGSFSRGEEREDSDVDLLIWSTRGQECCALGVLCVNYDKISLECDALKQTILRQVFE